MAKQFGPKFGLSPVAQEYDLHKETCGFDAISAEFEAADFGLAMLGEHNKTDTGIETNAFTPKYDPDDSKD